jgi:hypothetical protein
MKSGSNLIKILLLVTVGLLMASGSAGARPLSQIVNYKENVADRPVLYVENTNNTRAGGNAIVGINSSEYVWRPAIYGESLGSTAGIYGRSDKWHATVGYQKGSGGFAGVYGYNVGTGPGVYGVSDKEVSGNHGVYGETQGNWGWASGVYGKAFKPQAIGVTGWNTSSGPGVYGYSEKGVAIVAKGPSGNLIEAWDTSPQDLRFYVRNDGTVFADGRFNQGGADLAELLPASRGVEPGDVLIMGADGKLARSASPYDPAVVGVYSTEPGFVGGADLDGKTEGKAPVAIAGIVPCKVSAENGPIAVGTLLTTSHTAGHAMKAVNAPPGTVVGKALGELREGAGVIDILVMLR